MDGSNASFFLSILLMLGLVAAAYYLSRKMSGKSVGIRKSRYMKSIDRLAVGRDRWIEMVRIGERVLVVGVTGHTMEVLETLPADTLEGAGAESQEDLFKNILGKFMARKT